jgi:hypothetical protein
MTDEPAEHNWQLAEDQTLPVAQAVEIGARVWQCTKCFEKVYLRNEPPVLYHIERWWKILPLINRSIGDVDKIGCTELILKAVHES